MKRELGVDASLSKGSGGIFEVAVNGKTVASKGLAGFPAEAEIVEAVRHAL